MANDWFQFKQFRIHQARAVFKVGTDACLLGAWAPTTGMNSVLDIGSGTGILALMMAQRTENTLIHAIEPEENSYLQALSNFESSPWRDRLRCFHSSLQEFAPALQYDMVVCNPPFFAASTKNRDTLKSAARHEDTLSLDTLLNVSAGLVSPGGKLSLVLPAERRKNFEAMAGANGWFEERLLNVCPTQAKPPHRFLSTLSRQNPVKATCEELTLFESPNVYTENAARLLADFYLKL